MLQVIEGQFLTPEVTDDYLENVKSILGNTQQEKKLYQQ